jgi:hypothetical protein
MRRNRGRIVVERPHTWPSDRVVLAVGGVGIGLVLAAHVVNDLTVDNPLLNVSREANLPTWWSSSLFLLAAATCLVVAGFGPGPWPAWAAVGLAMVAFSADEVAGFHERISGKVGADTAELGFQPVLAVVLAVVVAWLGWRVGGMARPWLSMAAVSIVFGHLAELAGRLDAEWVPHVSVLFEEGFEMALALFVLAASWSCAAALLHLDGSATSPAVTTPSAATEWAKRPTLRSAMGDRTSAGPEVRYRT